MIGNPNCSKMDNTNGEQMLLPDEWYNACTALRCVK